MIDKLIRININILVLFTLIILLSKYCYSCNFQYNDSISINSNNLNDSVRKIETLQKKTKVQLSDSSNTKLTIDSTKQSSSSLDTVVVYSSKDSVVFNIKNKSLRLKGDSKLLYKDQKLEADIIEMYFEESLLKAQGSKDSLNKYYGLPKFTDKDETYIGEKVQYNFKTKQGTINLGETEMTEGFYFGSKIKRVSEKELFIQNGCYTTCDDAHPHFYFGSPTMKVVANDRVFLDPIIFYVEDMPLFIVPVGLFFPNKTGRQSGLIIPSFFFSKTRGVTLENLGVYLALSDYYDTQFLVDFYSKGGYTLKNRTNWNLRYWFRGNMEIQYGYTRYNPDDDYQRNWSISLHHEQTIVPNKTSVNANLSFASKDFLRNTSTNLQDRLTQNIQSDASISHVFDNGASLSAFFSRTQNIIDDTYSQTSPSLNFSLPNINPFKSLVSSDNFLSSISFSYSANANYTENKSIKYESKVVNDTTVIDTSFSYTHNSKITHSPRISYTMPKLGYFSITPSFSFNFNNYFRRMTRHFNSEDSTTYDTYENGLFWEYRYDFNVNVQTTLFGVIKPKIFGLNVFRHVMKPSITYNFSPDLSDEKYGFYDQYYNEGTKEYVRYNRYESDGGGLAPTMLSNSLNFSISNVFEGKIAQGDTIEDKKLQFLTLDLSGGYNFAADSLKFSDINMNFRTPAISAFSFNGRAGFTLYDQAKKYDPIGDSLTRNYVKIDEFLLSNGKGIARLTNFNLSLSTSFSFGEGLTNNSETNSPKDSVGLGERFSKRLEDIDDNFDFFGDNSPGYSELIIPFKIGLNLNFNYSNYIVNVFSRTLNLGVNFSFNLTPSWAFEGRLDYDFVNNELLRPELKIKKDLHCWELNFTWYPIGFSQGFYLYFGIRAPQLKDLKLEKRSSPIY